MKYGRGAGREGKGGGRQAESREAAAQNLKTLAIAAHTGTHTARNTHRDTNYIRSLVFAQIIWVTICRERRVRRGVAGRCLVESCCLAYWQERTTTTTS